MADDLDAILGTNAVRTSQAQTPGFGGTSATLPGKASVINLLPNEQVLFESDGKTLILTTHRVRYDSQRVGGGEIISIMLEELASCSIVRRSKPVLLVLAGVLLLFSLYLCIRGPGLGYFGLMITTVLVVAYFVTCRQVMELASAGAAIRINAGSMSILAIRNFLDKTEASKNARYFSDSTRGW